ncbi:class I SAM-dependent methyltransferase [Pararhizobium sp. BT-229]|uniref:class I SAM-dependent methyltransferase n=1 Tax=Pararhizobium sp. BT-229 TaxID=2986923 RepID=UPI0021F78C61|nr:class I SAM-dependent methyltransferase [Pararhizobium sp. BT-229]MCV9967048.1 class I SAM-dependent methyltransferase [Pararhizobium sp. BT-229]
MKALAGKRLSALFSTVRYKLRHDGVIEVLRLLISKFHALYEQRPTHAPNTFDGEFGTDTEEIVPLWKLDIDSPYLKDGIRYQAVDAKPLRTAIEALPIHPQEFAYVDLGSGKGRSLLVASEYPFKRVLGIEFSEELHNIAAENIRRYKNPKQKCENVVSICADAAAYAFPPENTVVFLYNPFGETVLSRVLENLEISLRRGGWDLYIVYCNPVLAPLLDKEAFLKRMELPVSAAVYSNLR